jgi:hypothetical protein
MVIMPDRTFTILGLLVALPIVIRQVVAWRRGEGVAPV